MSHCAWASGLGLVADVGALVQPEMGVPPASKETVPVIWVAPPPVGAIVAVMRTGTPLAACTAGRVVVVALVVADAEVFVVTKNPQADATPTTAVMRARRMPPPLPPFPAWREVYGRSFC